MELNKWSKDPRYFSNELNNIELYFRYITQNDAENDIPKQILRAQIKEGKYYLYFITFIIAIILAVFVFTAIS